MTDANGNEATRLQYLPFGEIDQAHSNGGYTAPKDYTGQERDPESGLMYYHARYYDPALGRFLTPDSIIPDMRDAQSFNRYAYARNNPIANNDPTGHCKNVFDCNGIGGGGSSCQIFCGSGGASVGIGAAIGPGLGLTAALFGIGGDATKSPAAQAITELAAALSHLGASDFSPNYDQDIRPNTGQFDRAPDYNQLNLSRSGQDTLVDLVAIGAAALVIWACLGVCAPWLAAGLAAGASGLVSGYGHAKLKGRSDMQAFNIGVANGLAWGAAAALTVYGLGPEGLNLINPSSIEGGGYFLMSTLPVYTEYQDFNERKRKEN